MAPGQYRVRSSAVIKASTILYKAIQIIGATIIHIYEQLEKNTTCLWSIYAAILVYLTMLLFSSVKSIY